MEKKLTEGDKWKLFGMGCTLIAGLWGLWITNISGSNMYMHIKFIYSIFLTLAICIAAYYIILKREDKKNGKGK